MLKVIRGDSQFSPELTNKLYSEASKAAAENRKLFEQYEAELEKSKEGYAYFRQDYDDIISWSKLFDVSGMDVKKMIASKLIRNVRVSRDYQLDIDLNITCEQLKISPAVKGGKFGVVLVIAAFLH